MFQLDICLELCVVFFFGVKRAYNCKQKQGTSLVYIAKIVSPVSTNFIGSVELLSWSIVNNNSIKLEFDLNRDHDPLNDL